MNLQQLGWTERRDAQFRETFAAPSRAFPARIARVDHSLVTLWSEHGLARAKVPHKLRRGSNTLAVGDWVVVAGDGEIDCALPRTTELARRAAGRAMKRQVVAANLDHVFVVTGLDGDFNPRRLERYLAAVGDGGSEAVVVLTKAGLCSDVEPLLADAVRVAGRVPVHAVDVLAGVNVAAFEPYLRASATVALVGSSGAGKSTLINAWLGDGRQRTRPVRSSDERGVHTTTARELFRLRSGALVIDTPGMRQVGLCGHTDGVDEAFSEIKDLAERCRFRDCYHRTEPGCAVRDAVECGDLERDRLESYAALLSEAEHTSALSSHEERRKGRAGAKMIREAKRWKKGWR